MHAALGSEAPCGGWDDAASGCWSDQECTGYQGVQELRRLCAAVAASVITHCSLAEEFAGSFRAQLPNVCGCSLAVLGGEGRSLRCVPLMEQGTICMGPGTSAKKVERESAAWQSFRQRKTLVWRRSGGHNMFPDWRGVLKVHAATALVTAPLLDASCTAVGSATFALDTEPSGAELELLEMFGRGVGQHYSHQTKQMWEVSLGFLNSVLPRHMARRMLSATVSCDLGSLAPAAQGLFRGEARRSPALALSPAVSLKGPGQEEGGAEEGPGPARPTAPTALVSMELAAAPPAAGLGDMIEAGGAAAPSKGVGRRDSALASTRAGSSYVALASCCAATAKPGASPLGSPLGSGFASSLSSDSTSANLLRFLLQGIPLQDLPLQKWTLEFADPRLEEAYKTWFKRRQTSTDLLVFRSYMIMLLLAMVVLLVRGSLSWGALFFCCQVLASVALPAYLLEWQGGWYVRKRSLVVAAARITSCLIILLHSLCHPELYQDSLLKALCGNCVLSMALNTFRSKLCFSNHLISQLVKLYLCSIFNAFIYSDAAQAGQQYLTLTQATLAQLAGVLLPSIGLYRMEARMRRAFVQRQGGAM